MIRQAVPDFDHYDDSIVVSDARCVDNGVEVVWPDGSRSTFNRFTLRENDPSPATTHPETREQTLPLTDIPEDLAVIAAGVTDQGSLTVKWSTGEASEFHAGWLHAWAQGTDSNVHQLPEHVIWDGSTMNEVPRFEGNAVLSDEDQFQSWCRALHIYGFAVLEHLPVTDEVVEEVAGRIGPVRATNFGYTFDVRADTEQTSLAYTSMTLAMHGDLCTREYMPGLQYLHCMKNAVDGGESQLADGYHLARIVEANEPDHYKTLTTMPFSFYNKAEDTDFRWEAPVIRCNDRGEPTEIRLSPWLRAPIRLGNEEVERCYQALRYLLEITHQPAHHIQFKLAAGDLLTFDNRRLVHGRTGYDASAGDRHLKGCYGEREDLWSQIRIGMRRSRLSQG